MRITERKEQTITQVTDVLIARKCDICGKIIEKVKHECWGGTGDLYNYFLITTHHNDWGNDSIESYEHYDACCPDCVIKFTEKYVREAQERPGIINSKAIEIEHVNSLSAGTWEE